MKLLYGLGMLLFPFISFTQLKQIAFAELSAGSGMFFGAEMSTTTITVTVQGPSDRYLAFGLGTGMGNGNDAMIWSTLGSGAAPLQLRDHRMIGTGSEPSVDAQQDWTVISNNVTGGNRTIVASRALNTGDANDIAISFSNTSQNLFWAKGAGATNQLNNHGGGNRASGIVRNWVLVDQTAPLLNTFNPADNASGVSLTANLVMVFNEPVSLGTGSITLYNGSNTVIQSVTSGSPGLSVSGSTVTFNPTANLIVGTDYYLHVDPTAVKDAAGNFYAGFSDNTTWNFNTNDIVAPVLAANPFMPADNAQAVSLTTNLSATFNENIQAGTGLIELYSGTNTLVESFDVATSQLVSVTGAAIVINPTADLVQQTSYYVRISAGAIKDMAGNNYAGITNNTTWNFNTNDIVAPLAVTFIPADNSSDIAVSSNLLVVFNENIFLTATGSLKLFLANGTQVESFTNASTGISVNNNTITINPTADLTGLTSYYVIIDAGFVVDGGSNPYAGITANTDWNFTTEDNIAPVISGAFSPADNALSVPVSSNFVASFSEPVVLGSGNILLVDDTDGSGDLVFDAATSAEVSVSGNMLTINPAANLESSTNYHVVILGGAVKDLAGNNFSGILDVTAWNFSTESGLGTAELAAGGVKWDGKILSFSSSVTGSVCDATGKIVKKQLAAVTDCSDLTPGVYFVRAETEKGTNSFRIYVR